MASIDYEYIFSDFLGKVNDNQLASLSDAEAYDLMSEYLQKTVSRPYINRLFSSVEADSDVQEIVFELEYPTNDSADVMFVQSILVKGMIVEWLNPQVRSKLAISQMFGTKEQKFYSQSNHLAEIRALLEDTELDLRKEIRDRGYVHNPYLEVTNHET